MLLKSVPYASLLSMEYGMHRNPKEASFKLSPFPPEQINLLWLNQSLTRICFVTPYIITWRMKISNKYNFLVFNKVIWQTHCCRMFYSHDTHSNLTTQIIFVGISSIVFSNYHIHMFSLNPYRIHSSNVQNGRK